MLSVSLLIDCHRATSLLDLRPSCGGDFVGGHGKFRGDIAVAKDLDRFVALGDHAELEKGLGRHLDIGRDPAGIGELLKSAQVDLLIVDTERGEETELRHAADQRHLASLEVRDLLEARARLVTLVSTRGGATMTGALAATDPFPVLGCPLRGAERSEMI